MQREIVSPARPFVLAALAVAATLAALAAYPVAASARRPPTRGVLVVSNNWAGTAHIIDLRTLRKLSGST